MKKRILSATSAILVVGVIGMLQVRTSSSCVTSNVLFTQNVEALTQSESQSERHYSSTHLACYKKVNYGGTVTTVPSGKYSAICWENENSTKGCHQHSCENYNKL